MFKTSLPAHRHLCILGMLAFIGCSEPKPQSATIAGGSMHPTLLGQHFDVQCNHCKYQFTIDGVDTPSSMKAVCPMCGNPDNDFSSLPKQTEDLRQIVPSDSYNRWDVVAVSQKDSSGSRLIVKRIVGLPGETISIRDGDLFVADRCQYKPRDIYTAVRQCVFDSKHNYSFEDFCRVSPFEGGRGWTIANNETLNFKHTAEEPDSEAPAQWLTFNNIRGYRHTGKRFRATPIEDSYGFNQNVARRLHRINDVELVFELTVDPTVVFRVKLQRDDEAIEIVLNIPEGNATFAVADREPLSHTLPPISAAKNYKLSIEHRDESVIVLLDSDPIFTLALLETAFPRSGDLQILVGANSGELKIDRWQIFRDIHYFGLDRPKKLAADEYFLLGDNPPVSVDSRAFGPIKLENIHGIVSE